MSIGGGRGALLTIHRDYPIAPLGGVKTQILEEGRAFAERMSIGDGDRAHLTDHHGEGPDAA